MLGAVVEPGKFALERLPDLEVITVLQGRAVLEEEGWDEAEPGAAASQEAGPETVGPVRSDRVVTGRQQGEVVRCRHPPRQPGEIFICIDQNIYLN